MNRFTNLILIIISAINISVADAIVKHITTTNTFWGSACSPWTYVAYLLYFIEIWLSILVFKLGGEFTIYTSLFMVFYSIFCLLLGNLYFHDVMTMRQMVGVGLGLSGAILMSI